MLALVGADRGLEFEIGRLKFKVPRRREDPPVIWGLRRPTTPIHTLLFFSYFTLQLHERACGVSPLRVAGRSPPGVPPIYGDAMPQPDARPLRCSFSWPPVSTLHSHNVSKHDVNWAQPAGTSRTAFGAQPPGAVGALPGTAPFEQRPGRCTWRKRRSPRARRWGLVAPCGTSGTRSSATRHSAHQAAAAAAAEAAPEQTAVRRRRAAARASVRGGGSRRLR
eukprot:scaffold125122_cov63-Phaeocystis_antarctica.AAC.2